MYSSSNFTALCGSTASPVPAGTRMYCLNDCSCCSHRNSKLQAVKDHIQLIYDVISSTVRGQRD